MRDLTALILVDKVFREGGATECAFRATVTEEERYPSSVDIQGFEKGGWMFS